MIADIPYYPTLEAKIAEKGYAKKDIAKELGISHRSLTSKLSGSVDFWWKTYFNQTKSLPLVR